MPYPQLIEELPAEGGLPHRRTYEMIWPSEDRVAFINPWGSGAGTSNRRVDSHIKISRKGMEIAPYDAD